MSTEVMADRVSTGRGAVASSAIWIIKTVALWFVVLVGSVAAGKLVPIELPPPQPDGPLSVAQAFLFVSGCIAVALSLVAANARVRGWRLMLMIFVAYFAIGSAMMQIETLWFNDSLKLPFAAVMQLVADGAIIAAITGVAAGLLFRQGPVPAAPLPANLSRRVAALALIYVVLYYGAGTFIAWQSEAVRTYYENGIHIQLLPTVAFQIFRGTLWALISVFLVTRLKGSLVRKAFIMAFLFFALTALQLLYPTPFFPWAVRSAHLVEVGTSEFIYGIVATLVLLGGARRNAISSTSAWRAVASI